MAVTSTHPNSILFMTLLSFVVSLLLFGIASARVNNVQGKQGVIYDGRSLIINGKRELIYSGSIHYPRSTPEMWPDLLDKAKHGGLNAIQTYVFWNVHEPEKGKFNFEGNYDLIKFLKLIQERDMFVSLRLGPFIQAEWNHGGLPYWLREIPGIIFRTDNEPFKLHMQQFSSTIVQRLKDANLFASQGGPIILAQIENEYDHVKLAYDEGGVNYVKWAAKMAVSLDIGVPWIMCKSTDAPDPVINACNGRHCGDTFTGPNKPFKPNIWTENWTVQYRVFGDPPSRRSAEDIAFAVARFFSKNGSLTNYYMYHGGTNFGRTSSAFSTTRYYDEAPLDEYGLKREPKWGHLRDVHRALNLCKKALLTGSTTVQRLNEFHEIRVYEKPESDLCAAFITNNHTNIPSSINFRGKNYYVPPHSISILPDCKNMVFNTLSVLSQHNKRNFERSKTANHLKWERFSETSPTAQQLPPNRKNPQELYSLLQDTSDYAWYTTSFELRANDLPKNGASPNLTILSLGHSLQTFVNGAFIGSTHGTHEEKTFEFKSPVKFKVGVNYITILGNTMGLPDSGAYMEHRFAGPKSVVILGLGSGKLDLTHNGWGHKVGLQGEMLGIFNESGSKNVQWKPVNGPGPVLSWYKTTFEAPEGDDPVAIHMTGMGKGMTWVNGRSIGRYWMSYLSPIGRPTQSEYHIPRAFLKPNDNLLVVLEEEPKSLEQIEILTVNRDTICSFIRENFPPNVNLWESNNMTLRSIVPNLATEASLTCPNNKKIEAVQFASFGDPSGDCGSFTMGRCHAQATKEIVERQCLGKAACKVPVNKAIFTQNGVDACPSLVKVLAIQVQCR